MKHLDSILEEYIIDYYKSTNIIPDINTILVKYPDIFINDSKFIDTYYKPIYNKIKNNILTNNNIYNIFKLRDYQEKYRIQVLNEFKENDRCLIESPTGSGKTKTAFSILASLIKTNSPTVYVFVSPLLKINTQCLQDTYILYSNYNTSNNYTKFIEIEVNSSNNAKDYNKKIKHAINNNNNIILSTTYQSFKFILDLNINIDLVIYDECHVIPKYIHEKNYFKNLDDKTNNPNCILNDELNINKQNWYDIFNSSLIKYRLFLTATPYTYQKLDTIKYGKTFCNVLIGELINNNILAPIETYIAKTTITETISSTPDIAHSIIKFIIDNKKHRICIFVNKATNAELLKQNILNCKLFNNFNKTSQIKIKEPIILSHISNYNTTELFSNNETPTNFNDNEIRIIISIKMLSMGVDIPCIDSIIFVDKRVNLTDISQCIGRGLRQFKYNNKTKICSILLFNDMNDSTKNNMILNYIKYLSQHKIIEYINSVSIYTNDKHKPGYKTKPGDEHIVKLDMYNGTLNVDLEYYDLFTKTKEYKLLKTRYDFQITCDTINTNIFDNILIINVSSTITNKNFKSTILDNYLGKQLSIWGFRNSCILKQLYNKLNKKTIILMFEKNTINILSFNDKITTNVSELSLSLWKSNKYELIFNMNLIHRAHVNNAKNKINLINNYSSKMNYQSPIYKTIDILPQLLLL